jgi:hypothetical protein
MTSRFLTLAAAFAVAITGCTSGPRAPALHGESVFQDDSEGFRFEPPSGWGMTVRTRLPTDQPVMQERKLVEFKLANPTKPASFTVSCLDAPANLDLLNQFAVNRPGPDSWRVSKPVAPVSVGGLEAQNFALTMGTGTKALAKEVTAFHRNGRHYFFVLLSHPDDVSAKEAGRRTMTTLTWKAN